MVACLVRFLCSVFLGFHWLLGPIGLVAEGLVRALPFWAFPWPFFYFWGAQLAIFSVFADFGSAFWGVVSACGGMVLDLVPSLWGDPDLRVRAWMCPLCYIDPLPDID